MAPNPWRAISATLALILLIQFYFLLGPRPPSSYSRVHAKAGEILGFWSYEPSRDSVNTVLSSEQCDKAFPKLYHEIDRSVAYWKSVGRTINGKTIDITNHSGPAFTVLIHDNQLSVTDHSESWLWHVWDERRIGFLNQLHRALLGASAAGEILRTVKFAAVVGDFAVLRTDWTMRSFFSLTRRLGDTQKESLWIVPDFNFLASPPNATSWHLAQSNARKHDSEITTKIPKFGLAWCSQHECWITWKPAGSHQR